MIYKHLFFVALYLISSLTAGCSGEKNTSAMTPPGATNIKWLTYSNTALGFSLNYPDSYAVFEEMPPLRGGGPGPIYRVFFQDKDLLSSQTADLEPPQFSIEIFELPSEIPYKDWLQQKGMIPLHSEVEVFPIAGRSGLKVTLRERIAPRQFVVVEKGGLIFRFTLLGLHSSAMLNSFRFRD